MFCFPMERTKYVLGSLHVGWVVVGGRLIDERNECVCPKAEEAVPLHHQTHSATPFSHQSLTKENKPNRAVGLRGFSHNDTLLLLFDTG